MILCVDFVKFLSVEVRIVHDISFSIFSFLLSFKYKITFIWFILCDKKSYIYIYLQSEGSGVWMAAPGRDISGLQANSFYNIPQGGQVAYMPTQVSHGTFASLYHHPAQPVTTSAVHPLLQQSQTLAGPGVDMVGPTPQINWPNNY